MKKIAIVFILYFASMCLGSCVKNEVGPKGDPGVSNIKTFTFSNQAIAPNPLDTNINQVTIDFADLSASIVLNGFLQAFVAPANSNKSTWTALPGLFSPAPGEVPFVQLNYQFSQGRLVIYTIQNPDFESVDVKVVLGN